MTDRLSVCREFERTGYCLNMQYCIYAHPGTPQEAALPVAPTPYAPRVLFLPFSFLCDSLFVFVFFCVGSADGCQSPG